MSGYGGLDRLAHRIAFAGPGVQRAAADIEDRACGERIGAAEVTGAVFVTALPRAGTTTLLRALAARPGMACHRYRDMPFVMAPLLWERMSARFRHEIAPQERAHGDGIAIDADSPEAFEEVLWQSFWPGHYGAGEIRPWRAEDADAEATQFLARHMRKVVALRLGAGARGRYLSKNNANVARLALIPRMVPGAEIVVPVRAPLSHAESLLRQHRNFARQHAEDGFVRRYMADIGHYEFGALHRPIAFPGFAERAAGLGPDDLDYWLAYWLAAYGEVARHREAVRIVDYAAMAEGPAEAEALCAGLGIDGAADIAAAFRPVPAPEAAGHRGALRDEAEALFAHLVGRAG